MYATASSLIIKSRTMSGEFILITTVWVSNRIEAILNNIFCLSVSCIIDVRTKLSSVVYFSSGVLAWPSTTSLGVHMWDRSPRGHSSGVGVSLWPRPLAKYQRQRLPPGSSRDAAKLKNPPNRNTKLTGVSGLYERNFKTVLCAREVFISKTKHILALGKSTRH